MSTPMFDLGRIVATPAALQVLTARQMTPLSLLQRHALGDWGDLVADDVKANQHALRNGWRLFSSYRLDPSTKVWIITEADRSVTTVLLPDEY